MQQSHEEKIEARSDYNRIKNNPITLLMAIEGHALNFQENRYYMSTILDAMRTLFLQSKRKEKVYKTTPKDFVWHEVRSSNSHSIGEPIILTKFVEAMDGYN